MDLANFDLQAAADKGAELHLENPITEEPIFTEDGKPVKIRVLGADSKEFRAAISDLAERYQGKKKTNMRAAEAHAVELLARVTVGWDNIIWEGETLKFSRENARMLYRERKWVREQVDAFVGDRSHFFDAAKPG